MKTRIMRPSEWILRIASENRLRFRLPMAWVVAGLLAGWVSAVPAALGQASLTVNLGPQGAVAAGAGWRFVGEAAWRNTGVAYTDLPSGTLFLEFKPLEGWIPPTWSNPVQLAAAEVATYFMEYRMLPLNPVLVTATEGGLVHEEAWQPALFTGLQPSSVPSSDPQRPNLEWERAARSRPRLATMPRDNARWRVQLRAVASPGYQFVGWSGDASGARNPMTLIVGGTKNIRAHFARPLTVPAASLTAEPFISPGRVTLHGQFSYPVGDRLQTLRWRPQLPAGWKIARVQGLGRPALRDGIAFEGSLEFNPIQFNLVLDVPAGETAARSIQGEVDWSLVDLTGKAYSGVSPVVSVAGSPIVTLVNGPSSAALLKLGISVGRSQLTVQGVVGRTYTIEQTPWFPLPTQGLQTWVYLGDLTLTNATQVFVDPLPMVPSGSTFYRATILE